MLLDPPPRMTAKPRHSVLVYAANPPTRPHTQVASLEVEERHGIAEKGLDLAVDRLRTRAAELGCDGLVVGGIRERDASSPNATSLPDVAYHLVDSGATSLHGTCIVFVNRAPAAGRECPCRVR
jgi:hypothetical protein